MAKWILGLSFFFGVLLSCQSEKTTDAPEESLPSESGTVVLSQAAIPLSFFLKEVEVLNNGDQISVRDTALFRSLPSGVYPIESDSIIFGKPPMQWISSGITRWPRREKISLTDLIISDNPLNINEMAIFPQIPGKNGYLPGCFGCPDWMTRQYGALLIFWEKHSMNAAF